MSEELNQRDLIHNPEKIGDFDFRNIGSTTLMQLKNAGIISAKNYKDFEKRKPDAIISIPNVVKSRIKTTIGIIEHKDISKFKTQKQKKSAIQQGLEVAEVLEAKILIVTDTKETIWINALNGEEITDEKGRIVKENFDKNNPDLGMLIEKIYDSLDKENSQIREPRLKDPTRLAKSIWQDLWMAAGATPENCLYSFVELFIFKYLSDLNVLPSHLNYDKLMQIYNESGDAEATLDFYAGTIRKEIKKLFKPSEKDNTTIINGTIFVSKDEEAVKGYGTVFIKILKKFGDEREGGGELKNIDRDFKSKLFETFLKESISKKNWGQYFTPLRVVRAIAKMAQNEIKPNITLCDPACGVGKFLLEPLLVDNDLDDFFAVKNGKLESKIKLIGIDKGFDKEEQKTIILAKANMLIYLSDLIRKNGGIASQFSDLFNKTFELKTKNILGTLRDVQYENKIDLILTNPPYVTTGSSNLKEEISKVDELKKFYTVNGIGVEGLFMEWIIRSLKPGGKAFVVVPDGIFNRQGDKNLRQFILDECIIDGIISLPLNTFFTTNKKTYIFAITKKMNKAERQTTPVFTYLVSEIGESRDTYRFEIEQDDLQDSVEYFNAFKGNKKGFHKFNNNPRCKLFDISVFEQNIQSSSAWIIDKWWSEEEKISLGFIERKTKLNVLDFAIFIEDIANTMKGFEEELKEIAQKKKSDIKYKDFKLKDIFFIEKGKSIYTKNYGNLNKGDYPVYSASNKAPLTFIDTYDYEGKFLTWATNGFAGYFKLVEGKFSFNSDRALLRPRIQGINLEYIKEKLEPIFRSLAKGRKGEAGEDEFTKVYPSMVEDIVISLPVGSNGDLDTEQQFIVADKAIYVQELKSKIKEYQKQIEDLDVGIGEEYSYKEYEFSNIFDIQDGYAFPSSVYTTDKSEIKLIRIQDINPKKNNKEIRIPRDYAFTNKNKFWVKKGDFLLSLSGTIGFNFWNGEEGYLNQRISKIKIKEEYKDSIIVDFKNVLFAQIYEELKVKIRGSNNNLNRIDIIEIKLKLPINSKGEFDLKKQKEIANKYRKIEEIKRSISEELNKISDVEINYE